jgi:hypothetical protein
MMCPCRPLAFGAACSSGRGALVIGCSPSLPAQPTPIRLYGPPLPPLQADAAAPRRSPGPGGAGLATALGRELPLRCYRPPHGRSRHLAAPCRRGAGGGCLGRAAAMTGRSFLQHCFLPPGQNYSQGLLMFPGGTRFSGGTRLRILPPGRNGPAFTCSPGFVQNHFDILASVALSSIQHVAARSRVALGRGYARTQNSGAIQPAAREPCLLLSTIISLLYLRPVRTTPPSLRSH